MRDLFAHACNGRGPDGCYGCLLALWWPANAQAVEGPNGEPNPYDLRVEQRARWTRLRDELAPGHRDRQYVASERSADDPWG